MQDNPIAHICQNCGNDLKGNYCFECGQKGTAAHDRSVKYILEHFFEELFVWDSRFFRSMKYLFTRPGYLTHEYISGRVVRYISPLKMFLFTSFVLFFIMIKSDSDQYKAMVIESTEEDDVIKEFILEKESESGQTNEMYVKNFNDEVNDNITLYIFVIMFLFSIALALVYVTKKIYYSEHIVFTLHFFSFVLWSFLLGVITQGIDDFFVFFFIYLVPAVYLVLSVKGVYHKTYFKAFLAGGFLSFVYWILVTIWLMGTIFLGAVRA